MFKRLKLRYKDMQTISKLISGADHQAHLGGDNTPGAEHFVLSALALNDGSAKRVFNQLGAGTDDFKKAVNQQYNDALSSIGLENLTSEANPAPVEADKYLQQSQPSGQQIVKLLYALKQNDKDRPLLGAHVLSVAAEMEHGVVARAFAVMGIDRLQLAQLARDEVEVYS